jgi:hypothetical protein
MWRSAQRATGADPEPGVSINQSTPAGYDCCNWPNARSRYSRRPPYGSRIDRSTSVEKTYTRLPALFLKLERVLGRRRLACLTHCDQEKHARGPGYLSARLTSTISREGPLRQSAVFSRCSCCRVTVSSSLVVGGAWASSLTTMRTPISAGYLAHASRSVYVLSYRVSRKCRASAANST